MNLWDFIVCQRVLLHINYQYMGTLGTSASGVTSLWFRPKYRFSWQFFSHTVRDAPESSKPTLPPIAGIEPHPRISQASHPSTPLSPGPSQALPPGGRVEFYAGLSLTRRKWHKGRNTLENFSGRFYVCGQHSDSHTFSFQYTLFTRAPIQSGWLTFMGCDVMSTRTPAHTQRDTQVL